MAFGYWFNDDLTQWLSLNYMENQAVLYDDAVMISSAFTRPEPCKHEGWYHYVTFLCFRKKFLACEKCGELVPATKWKLF